MMDETERKDERVVLRGEINNRAYSGRKIGYDKKLAKWPPMAKTSPLTKT